MFAHLGRVRILWLAFLLFSLLLAGWCSLSFCDKRRTFDQSHDSLLHLLRSKVEQSRRGRHLDGQWRYEDTRAPLGAAARQWPPRWSSAQRTRTIPDIEPDVDNVPPPPMVMPEAQPVPEVIKEGGGNEDGDGNDKKHDQKIIKLEGSNLKVTKNTTSAAITTTMLSSSQTTTSTSATSAIPLVISSTAAAFKNVTTTTLTPTISSSTTSAVAAAAAPITTTTMTTTTATNVVKIESPEPQVESPEVSIDSTQYTHNTMASITTTTSTAPPEPPQAAALEGVAKEAENTDDNRILRKAFLEFLANKMNASSPVPEWSTGSQSQPPETENVDDGGGGQQSSMTTEDPAPELDDSVIESLTLEELEQILQINDPTTTSTTTAAPTNQRPWPMSPDSSRIRWDVPREAKYDLSTSGSRINQLLRQVTKSSHQGSGGYEDEDELECGGFLNITTYADISSPNYPSRYPPNTDCRWVVTAPENQILRVKIIKLVIEHDNTCRFDYLDIKGIHTIDNKTNRIIKQTKRYCGSYLNGEEFMIGSHQTVIVFHSDLSNEAQGFSLTVTAETANQCDQKVHVMNTTYITSPKYPELYDNSENCWTALTTQNEHRLLLYFEDLKLEGSPKCEFDYVEVFDSDSKEEKHSLGKFCQLPENSSLLMASSGQHMMLHFVTDNLVAMRGYRARINSLRTDVNVSNYLSCNWDVDWQNMTIASPFYPKPYPPNTQCETSISALSTDERIIILFDWIDLVNEEQITALTSPMAKSPTMVPPSNTSKCQLDRLEIWESIKDTEPSTILCGYRSKPFKYISKSHSIKLVFKSSGHLDTVRAKTERQRQSQQQQQQQQQQFGDMSEVNAGFQAKFAIISANLYNKMNADNNKNSNNQTLLMDELNSVKSASGLIPLEDIVAMEGVNGTPPLPPPVLIRRPENATVMLGSSHVLHCEVGHPTLPQSTITSAFSDPRQSRDTTRQRPSHLISWFKGDREIHDGVSPDGTSLLIRQFTMNSVGRYICVYGDNSTDAWLSVREDTETCHNSSVLFRVRPKDQYTSEGEFVMLHCSATLANSIGEDAEVSWERLPLHSGKDGAGELQPVPVVYNSRIRKLKRGDLLFDAAFVEDSGYYFCVVHLNASTNKAAYQAEARVDFDVNQTDEAKILLSKIKSYIKDHNNNNNHNNQGCAFKSAARVQINQRVDISQYCGRSTIKKNENARPAKGEIGKIIGGSEAEMGEFPWMVMFWDEKRHVFCGGSLVNERWVVTAAHCFTDISDESTVFVKLGKFDQTANEPTELVTKIQHIIKHPQFSNETFDNDIALVKLGQHITFTNYILPICLPQSSDEVGTLNSIFFGYYGTSNVSGNNNNYNSNNDNELKFGWVTGWGRLKENGPLPRYLHKIRLPIVDDNKCRISTSFRVTENMFCAGYGTEVVGDACKGDSGGPFAVIHENRWTLLGVTSWGEGCGRPEKFGYYTKLNNFENWIRRLTRMT